MNCVKDSVFCVSASFVSCAGVLYCFCYWPQACSLGMLTNSWIRFMITAVYTIADAATVTMGGAVCRSLGG